LILLIVIDITKGFFMYSLRPQAFYRRFMLFATLAMTVVLSGCGFHLKHSDGLVEKFPEVYVQTNNPKGELARLVKLRLVGANIKVLTAPNEETAIIRLISEKQSKRTISLYATAQNAEKEIGYIMKYSLKMPNYTPKNFSVNLYRDFLYDSTQALAKSREEEQLIEELRVVAADHIISTMLSIENDSPE